MPQASAMICLAQARKGRRYCRSSVSEREMRRIDMSSEQVQEYRGVMTLPGEQEERGVSLSLDAAAPSVSIRFDEPIEGSAEWQVEGLTVANRLKYNEVVFYTTGLPKETVQVTWKFNSSLLDDSLAGVVIARPNTLRVTGEKGFVLTKVG